MGAGCACEVICAFSWTGVWIPLLHRLILPGRAIRLISWEAVDISTIFGDHPLWRSVVVVSMSMFEIRGSECCYLVLRSLLVGRDV